MTCHLTLLRPNPVTNPPTPAGRVIQERHRAKLSKQIGRDVTGTKIHQIGRQSVERKINDISIFIIYGYAAKVPQSLLS